MRCSRTRLCAGGGFDPGDLLWQRKCAIGGGGSGWQALLAYAMRTTEELPGHATEGRIGLNLQELLVGHLLTEWAARAGVDPDRSTGPAAPGYVRHAVQYIREYARELPTASDIADAVGVSVRTLSGSFRKYLNTTPAEYVREQRLQASGRNCSPHRRARPSLDRRRVGIRQPRPLRGRLPSPVR